LTSGWKGDKEPPNEAFARAATKPLSADQLYDSVNRVLARRVNGAGMAGLPASPLLDPTRQAFLSRIQSPSRTATEYSAGALQALMLMNGTDIAMATAPKDSALLASMSAPWLADSDRVEILFLATLSRIPNEEERQMFAEHASAATSEEEKELAWSDLLWVILNSAEFAINH
jgi:hypothetical protein